MIEKEKRRKEEEGTGNREQGTEGTQSAIGNRQSTMPSSFILHPSSLPSVILAGGKAKADMQTLTGQSSRALVTINGKTLLRHVVDALLTGGEEDRPLGPLAVVGDMPPSEDYIGVPDAGDFVANVFAGLAQFADAPYVLIATSDLPFMTGRVAGDFARGGLAYAQAHDSDIVWPIVPVQACYARFPGVKRTALKLSEGEFTGGNLALVRPQFLCAQERRIAGAYAARKSPLKLAAMLGFGTVGRLVLSQKLNPRLLTLPLLEARIGRLLGGKANAYISQDPELATDLDRPSDFKAVSG